MRLSLPVAALITLSLLAADALAANRPSSLTPEQLAAADRFRQDFVAQRKAKEPRPTPEWVHQMYDQYINHLTQRAERANKGGIWMYEDHDPRRATELAATALVRDLAKSVDGDLTKLPGYTPERHKEAVAFWQSWQNAETGRFYNPRLQDPKNPKNPAAVCNEKYVINLLGVLGAKPLHEHSFTRAEKAGQFNPKQLAVYSAGQGAYSPFGMMVVEAMSAIDDGQTDLIPAVENAVTTVMKKQHPETGLWWAQGRVGLQGYGPTACNLKLLGRLSSYLGTEGIPLERMADTLIEETPKGTFMSNNRCIPRNVAELLAIAIDHSDYRRDDLLRAMEQLLEQYGENHVYSRYTDHYGIGILCGYLNCQDCPVENPMLHGLHYRGALWRYKIVVDEDGQARVVEKKPEELVWNMKKYAK